MSDKKKEPRYPTPQDVMNMMVLRQYALAIEKRSMELYWTDPKLFTTLQSALVGLLADYKAVAGPYLDTPPDSCDPLYLCGDGTCRAEGDCPS